MEFSDDEAFDLTQSSVMDYEETNSCEFGYDVIGGSVSIENVGFPTFDICGDFKDLCEPTQKKCIYDNVQIEDISSDEELDKM